MKTIYLEIQNSIVQKKKIEQQLFWYDIKDKKMRTFQDSNLQFKYNFSSKKIDVDVEQKM
jgi:hypothetical protein